MAWLNPIIHSFRCTYICYLAVVKGHQISRSNYNSQTIVTEHQHQLAMHHSVTRKLGKRRREQGYWPVPDAAFLDSWVGGVFNEDQVAGAVSGKLGKEPFVLDTIRGKDQLPPGLRRGKETGQESGAQDFALQVLHGQLLPGLQDWPL